MNLISCKDIAERVMDDNTRKLFFTHCLSSRNYPISEPLGGTVNKKQMTKWNRAGLRH